MQEGLNQTRKFYVLEKALRTLTNMVPEPKNEDTGKALSPSELRYHLLHDSNVFQPQECLGGHPAIEFVLSNDNVCKFSKTKSPTRTNNSYLHEIFLPDDDDPKTMGKFTLQTF